MLYHLRLDTCGFIKITFIPTKKILWLGWILYFYEPFITYDTEELMENKWLTPTDGFYILWMLRNLTSVQLLKPHFPQIMYNIH